MALELATSVVLGGSSGGLLAIRTGRRSAGNSDFGQNAEGILTWLVGLGTITTLGLAHRRLATAQQQGRGSWFMLVVSVFTVFTIIAVVVDFARRVP